MELFRRLQTLARDSSFSLERRLINVYLGWRQDSIFACCKNARLTVISFFAVSKEKRWPAFINFFAALESEVTKENLLTRIDPSSSLIPLQRNEDSMEVTWLSVNKAKFVALNVFVIISFMGYNGGAYLLPKPCHW